MIEVADTTLGNDLGVKRSMYAGNAVPEYWMVDINARSVHMHWAPENDGYTQSCVAPLDGDLRSATMPALVIDGIGLL